MNDSSLAEPFARSEQTWLTLVLLAIKWVPSNFGRVIWLKKKEENRLGISVRNLEEISYKRTITRLPLRANDVNLEQFSTYAYWNAIPQTVDYH